MKKINISDLFEQEDVFKGIRKSAIDTIETLQKVQSELKESAKVIQNDIKNSSTNSAKGLKEFSDAAKAASQVMKDSALIAKQQAQAEQQRIKVDQELVKLEKLKAQEISRANKQAEKAAAVAAKLAKETANQNSAYKQLEKSTRDLKNQSKELGAQLLAMEKAGNQGTAAYAKLEKQFVEVTNEARKLDTELKDVDKSVGDNFRNVGNYEGATRNLKTELRALTRELMNMETSDPRFQEMTQRAGELKDQISDTQAVVKATAGSAMENFAGATAKAGQIGVAAFQGVEASMQLLGVENENVLEGMRRLQALAGLGDALKTLGGLGDALTEIRAGFSAAISKMVQFTAVQNTQNTAVAAGGSGFTKMGAAAKTALNGIRGGIAATGIGLLVVALGTVVAYWDDIKEAVMGVSAEQKKYNQQLDKDIESQKHKGAMLDAQENTLRLQGKSEKQIIQYKIDQINAEIELAKKKLKTEEITSAAQIEAAKRNQEITKMIIQGSLNFAALGLRLLVAPIDMVLETANLVSEKLGFGKITATNLNKEITKLIDFGAEAGSKFLFDPAQMKLDSQKTINEMKLGIAQMEGERDGLILSQKQNEKNASKESLKNSKDKADAEIDIIRRLEDEKMAMREESRKKDLDALALEYKRKLEDAKTELKDDKEKASKIAALEKQYQENIRAGIKEINDKWDAIDAEEEKKKVNEMIADDQKQYEAQKKLRDAETALLKDGLAKDKKLIEDAYQDELWSLQNMLDEKKITQDEYDKLTRLAYKKRNKDISDAEKKNADEQKEKDKKINEEKWKTTQEFAQKTTDFFKAQSEERIKQIDKEISAAEKQADYYRELAANGNISAKESLAEQERIIAESNRRKEREQKRQQRMELANTIYQTYASHAAKDPETALMKTIKDASLLQAFISTLPMFYEGTETTVSNALGMPQLPGKDGHIIRVDGAEKILNPKLSAMTGNMTTEQIAKVAQDYQNGKLIGLGTASQLANALDFHVMVSKLDELTNVIKHKPETNIELGEITQSAMEIVKSTRKGNTTVYNRFKVRS